MPILPTFPLSREFINGSDAFCTSKASGMLSAMLEKLRSAAGSDGQQCQILQQVSSIEVHGDAGAGSRWDRSQFPEKLDYLMLEGLDALGWSPCDTLFQACEQRADSVIGFLGCSRGQRGLFVSWVLQPGGPQGAATSPLKQSCGDPPEPLSPHGPTHPQLLAPGGHLTRCSPFSARVFDFSFPWAVWGCVSSCRELWVSFLGLFLLSRLLEVLFLSQPSGQQSSEHQG